MKPFCRHCKIRRANKNRGLCYTCYYTISIRNLYPSDSKFGKWCTEDGDFHGGFDLPMFPANAIPGTEEKILILQERASLRIALHHPDDLTWLK